MTEIAQTLHSVEQVSPYALRCVRFVRLLVVALCAVPLLGGCSETGTPSFTVPPGNPSAVTRPSNTSAAPVATSIEPGQLYVPAISVNAPIVSLPTEMSPDPFLGGRVVESFGVPPDMAQTAWWSDGPAVGSDAMAIIVGHSQIGGGYGVFNDLQHLEAGDEIAVENPDGTKRVTFSVISVKTGISKRDPDALQQTLIAQPDNARLALITCGGKADPSVMESDENVVVFAELA